MKKEKNAVIIILGIIISIAAANKLAGTGGIVQVIAALVGGFCTFFGVLITLRNQREKDIKIEFNESQPEFMIVNGNIGVNFRMHMCLKGATMPASIFHTKFVVQNTSKIEFCISKILINNAEYTPSKNRMIKRNDNVGIMFPFLNQIEHFTVYFYSMHKSNTYKFFQEFNLNSGNYVGGKINEIKSC